MRKFFSKSSKSLSSSNSTNMSPPPVAPGHTTGLQPKYVVPPVPHPHPHEYIALLATRSGLLMRPHVIGLRPDSHVRIKWGKSVKVEDVAGNGEHQSLDWSQSVIIYGIVGVLELFSASYLLVVTSRSDVGNLFDEMHAIYSVKHVAAIPLVEDRARKALQAIAFRNKATKRASLIAENNYSKDVADLLQVDSSDPETSRPPHVKDVAEGKQETPPPSLPRKLSSLSMTSGDDNFLSPLSSGTSTPLSDESLSNSAMFNTLSTRLSFWGRTSKQTSDPAKPLITDPTISLIEQETIESILQDSQNESSKELNSLLTAAEPPSASVDDRRSELEDRIVRECIKEFTKGGMFFAYNFDLTRSLQHKNEQFIKSRRENSLLVDLNAADKMATSSTADQVDVLAEPYRTLPLWRRVDRQFWWNEWLSGPFVDAGLHSYVLPIMQGYCQVASFNVPIEYASPDEENPLPVEYIIVSRRSRDRAGLRYQRRGVDDEAYVANFVETETIVRIQRNNVSNIFSYVQIRGSIPLFWTQSGYNMKPPPLLSPERTHDQNLDALKRHFKRTIPKYGPHTIVNLAEQDGKEAVVTHAYHDYVEEFGSPDVQYCEYDFHHETKGMKYENISKLIDSMERSFESQRYFWVSNGILLSTQKGVFRVNCIDCLDRTNVVQSAFARYVLNFHLEAVALLNPSESGKSETDVVFNDVWANNGDAISRAYAGTSALKGDFTRTGKRDLGGMLNDGVNSLARMYSSTFSDWFSQAVIDFMLGYRSVSVFSEFLLKLKSTDPRELIRLSKIRAEAIATCVSRLLDEGDRLLSGWTVFAPEQLNVKVSDKFEEKVLLLSARAFYIITYDYTLEKVKLYTRVPLGDIFKITKGAYIMSPLEEASRDPIQNAGFTVTWRNSEQVSTRMTSYSYRNRPQDGPPPSPSTSTIKSSANHRNRSPSRSKKTSSVTLSRILSTASQSAAHDANFAAFKVLPVDPARIRRGSSMGYAEPADDLIGATTCKEVVDLMVDAIERACEDVSHREERLVVEEDVVSLKEAQSMSNVFAKMEYGIKRLLWLGG